MPTIQERAGRFQLRVKHRLLPKPYFSTFESREEAEQYGDILMSWLKKGLVPKDLVADAPEVADPMLVQVVSAYEKLGPVTPSDKQLIDATLGDVLGVRVSHVTAAWADEFVKRLKMQVNNAPGTIRKKVGLYGRVLDWHFRRTTPPGAQKPVNALRHLPRGYSTYTHEEAAELKAKPSKVLATRGRGAGTMKKPKKDTVRDRRVLPEEIERIHRTMRGEKLQHAFKALIPRPDLEMLFDVIVDTGLRLREAYTLRMSHLELDKGFTHVDGTKGRGGVIKPRIVPLKPALVKKLRAYAEDKTDVIFPYWDGTEEGKQLATRALVQDFRRLFAHAKVEQFTEHDLRHEACCRWFELRDKKGHWMFSDVEICRIMGWSNYSMVLRYASIRGQDLAARMAA